LFVSCDYKGEETNLSKMDCSSDKKFDFFSNSKNAFEFAEIEDSWLQSNAI
jgi:hypothetical protein